MHTYSKDFDRGPFVMSLVVALLFLFQLCIVYADFNNIMNSCEMGSSDGRKMEILETLLSFRRETINCPLQKMKLKSARLMNLFTQTSEGQAFKSVVCYFMFAGTHLHTSYPNDQCFQNTRIHLDVLFKFATNTCRNHIGSSPCQSFHRFIERIFKNEKEPVSVLFPLGSLSDDSVAYLLRTYEDDIIAASKDFQFQWLDALLNFEFCEANVMKMLKMINLRQFSFNDVKTLLTSLLKNPLESRDDFNLVSKILLKLAEKVPRTLFNAQIWNDLYNSEDFNFIMEEEGDDLMEEEGVSAIYHFLGLEPLLHKFFPSTPSNVVTFESPRLNVRVAHILEALESLLEVSRLREQAFFPQSAEIIGNYVMDIEGSSEFEIFDVILNNNYYQIMHLLLHMPNSPFDQHFIDEYDFSNITCNSLVISEVLAKYNINYTFNGVCGHIQRIKKIVTNEILPSGFEFCRADAPFKTEVNVRIPIKVGKLKRKKALYNYVDIVPALLLFISNVPPSISTKCSQFGFLEMDNDNFTDFAIDLGYMASVLLDRYCQVVHHSHATAKIVFVSDVAIDEEETDVSDDATDVSEEEYEYSEEEMDISDWSESD